MFTHFEDPCQSLLTVVFPITPKNTKLTSKPGGTASTVMLLAGSPIVVSNTAHPRSASYEPRIPRIRDC